MAAARVFFKRDGMKLAELFDNEDSTTTMLEAIEQEWLDLNHIAPGKVVAAWRTERLLYQLTLPSDGWFIDIESAETISAIGAAIGSTLVNLGVEEFTTANLRGENREVTTTIADWLWTLTLADGSSPHGIYFGSKHDSAWRCWAIWLRAADDGDASSELVHADAGAEIKDCDHNPALAEVAGLFRFQCF